jgi:uracil phosphoribosyltransferase
VRLKERRAKEIRYVCLLAARQGLQKLRDLHPDVQVWTAAIDKDVDDQGFIVPGLGDAGDRAYGTK